MIGGADVTAGPSRIDGDAEARATFRRLVRGAIRPDSSRVWAGEDEPVVALGFGFLSGLEALAAARADRATRALAGEPPADRAVAIDAMSASGPDGLMLVRLDVEGFGEPILLDSGAHRGELSAMLHGPHVLCLLAEDELEGCESAEDVRAVALAWHVPPPDPPLADMFQRATRGSA